MITYILGIVPTHLIYTLTPMATSMSAIGATTAGIVQVASFVARPPDLGLELAVGRELLNAVVLEIGNVDLAVSV